MFSASFDQKRGWRVVADYTSIGGAVIDICGAANELVARETAVEMNALRGKGVI